MLRILSLLIFTFAFSPLFSQNEDPTLFTVDGKPVTVSEFKYIYEKSNGEKADYSEKSVTEYLDLYANFKLKVKRARALKIDTISSLQTELKGYYKQLSDSYLLDKEVTIPLCQEIYDRKDQDVDLSHILIKLDQYATPKDTLFAMKKIMAIKDLIDKKSKTFEEAASELSEDENTKKRNGRLGFMTAQFPTGYYALENEAYNAPVGQMVGPIKSKLGYHLVKVNNRRQSRGIIEVAHILFLAKNEQEFIAKGKTAEAMYKNLMNKGAEFDNMALQHSDDHGTAKKRGYVGFFGIGRYDINFEDAAFALENDGEISKPVKTTAGWHIIKRISKKEKPNFANFNKAVEKQLKESERYEMKYGRLIQSIMNNFEVVEYAPVLEKYVSGLDKEFFSYKYKTPQDKNPAELIKFNNNKTYTTEDFYAYLNKNSRKRMVRSKQGSPKNVATNLYNEWVAELCMKQQEEHLTEKYPKFKALMREYEEGIYLFEVTKMEVWDKAMNDSLGLAQFYENADKKYYFDDRVSATIYNVKPEGLKSLKKINKCAKKKSPAELTKKFNKKGDILSYTTKTFEKGQDKDIDAMKWSKGALSENVVDKKSKVTQFIKIENVEEPRQKTLSEARGFIIADYQDQLEQNWLKELHSTYKVEINQDVLKSIIK